MNKNKFDGPNFINPQHTSHSLNGGLYQTPTVNFNTNLNNNTNNLNSFNNLSHEDSKNKKGPRGGWDDDEETQIKTNNKFKKTSVKTTNHITSTGISNGGAIVNTDIKKEEIKSEGPYVNYWDAENTRKIQNSTLTIEYETKLIDDFLKPIGATVKPSESQLKEILKKLKTLNKQIVLNILFERLKNYENMGDNNQIKILTKLLYVIISTLHDKTEGYHEFFLENENIFSQISQFYSSNRKVNELCNEIIEYFHGGNTNYGIKNKFKPINDVNLIEEIIVKKNEDTKSNSDKNSSVSGEKQKFNFIKKKVDTDNNEDTEIEIRNKQFKIDEIFMNNGNFNTSTVNNSIANDITVNNISSNNNSKFSFIKTRKGEDSTANTLNNARGNELKFNELSNELNKVFSDTNKLEYNNSSQNVNTFNFLNSNSNSNSVSPNLLNNIVTDPIKVQVKTPKHKHYPANFDMLFDTALLTTGPSLLEASNSKIAEVSQGNNYSSKTLNKDHNFGFVNDLMKPKNK